MLKENMIYIIELRECENEKEAHEGSKMIVAGVGATTQKSSKVQYNNTIF